MLRLDSTRSTQSDTLYYSERNQRVDPSEKAAFEEDPPLTMATSTDVLSVQMGSAQCRIDIRERYTAKKQRVDRIQKLRMRPESTGFRPVRGYCRAVIRPY